MSTNMFKRDNNMKNQNYRYRNNYFPKKSEPKLEKLKEEFIMDEQLFPEMNIKENHQKTVQMNLECDFKTIIEKKIEHNENYDNEYENLKPGWMLLKYKNKTYGKIISKFKPLNEEPEETNYANNVAKILVDKWEKYKKRYEEDYGEGSYDDYYNAYYKNSPYGIPEYNFDDNDEDEDDDDESNDDIANMDEYDDY